MAIKARCFRFRLGIIFFEEIEERVKSEAEGTAADPAARELEEEGNVEVALGDGGTGTEGSILVDKPGKSSI